MGKRADLQGLRAIAVLVVVAEHLVHVPVGGFVGVDVFFVLSGFLITGILLRDHEKSGRISLVDFYRKRVRRILPAAAVVLVVTTAAGYAVFNAARAAGILQDAVWSAAFLANWRFAATGTDYFAASGPVSALQHFWSLAVEEQFYMVWPLLLIAIAALTRGDPRRMRIAGGSVLVGIVVLSFAWALVQSASEPAIAYFSTLTRVWEIGVGALLALATSRGLRLGRAARETLRWAGLAGVAASVVLVSGERAFPAPWGLLPVLSAAAVILAGTGDGRRGPWVLVNPVMVYIGDISYSLYLWHFPVIVVGGVYLDALGIQPAAAIVIQLAASFLLAVASYHGVEQPIRRSRWLLPAGSTRRSSRRGGIALAALATVTLALLVVAVVVRPGDGVSAPTAAETDAIITDTVDEEAAAQLAASIEAALQRDSWPDDLRPTLADVADEVLPGETARCGSVSLPDDPATCTFGDENASKTAVLVGDSIALMYVPALVEILGQGDWRLRIVAMYACPYLGIEVGDAQARVQACTERKQAEKRIVEEEQPDLLIVGNTFYRTTDAATGKRATVDDWTVGLVSAIEDVRDSAGDVLVLPPPAPDVDITVCMTALSSPGDCVSRVSNTDWTLMASTQRDALAGMGVTLLDNRHWFCDAQGQCPAFVDSILMKKDQAHITADYARAIVPVVREDLEATGLLPKAGGE